MQHHDETLSSASASPSTTSTELSMTPAAAVPIDVTTLEAMDDVVDASEASTSVHDLSIVHDDDDDDAAMSDAASGANAADTIGDDDDDDDDDDDASDSDYDFDDDAAAFDDEDDNDDVGPDERVHYFASLQSEIDEYKEDELVLNMRAQRPHLTGDDAAYVDAFLEAQATWKQQNNGRSVDDYSNIVRLARFIPTAVKPARPKRAVRK